MPAPDGRPRASDRPVVRLATTGTPVVLVHGSFGDSGVFAEVAGLLRDTCPVVAVERRGHGTRAATEPHLPPVRPDRDADDLADMLDRMRLGPALVVGASSGGTVALHLASRRPDLVRTVLVHEPPLFDLVSGRPEMDEDLEVVRAGLRDATALIAQNRTEAGTQVFVERVLLAPNGWADTASDDRSRMARHATAWLAQVRDRDAAPTVDARWTALATPVVLTYGTNSPALYAAIVHELGSRLPNCQVRPIAGAAHFPHLTAPVVYAALVRDVAAADTGESGLG
ncbi:MAG: alpha/beta fold hydrolase [Pseudonocardia sp.]